MYNCFVSPISYALSITESFYLYFHSFIFICFFIFHWDINPISFWMVNVMVKSPYDNQRALPFLISIVYFSLHVLLPVTIVFDSSFCTRWSQDNLFVLLRRRPTSLPPIASASCNFLSSSFSVLPTQVFIGGYEPEWPLFSRAPPSRFTSTTFHGVS